MLPQPITWTLTIDGQPKTLEAGSLTIRRVANQRSTASFRLLDEQQTYRPPLDGVVAMSANGVDVFGGLIDRPAESGQFPGVKRGIRTTVNVVDSWAYTEWRHVKETFPEQTLKDRLLAIVAYLADYSVTLHPSQVDGPILPSVVYDDTRVDAVLAETMRLTADSGQPFVVHISFGNVLRAQQPSTILAPFDLIGDDLSAFVKGDIEVEPSNDGQANKVIVKVAPKTEIGRKETFTGDGLTDTFTLQYQLTAFPRGIIHRYESDGVTPAGGETFGVTGTLDGNGNPVQWWYDVTTNSITRNIGPTEAGYVYSLEFDGTFSGRWEATDPSWDNPLLIKKRRQKVITLESIPVGTTGQAFAEAELAKSLTGPIFVRYTTLREGIEPGQQQTIDVPSRNINADGVVAEVVIRDKGKWLERQVTVVVDDAQTNLDRTWGDVYRIWAGDKTGAGTAPVTTTVTSTGPALPIKSVQYHAASGSFGGKDTFTFHDAQNSVVIGLGSSITATSFESCFIAGKNCHIVDA